MKKYLIIGSSGLLGTYLTKILIKDSMVLGISRSNSIDNSNKNFHWYTHDLNKPIDFSNLPADFDAIIYLAQSEFFRDLPKESCSLFQVNVCRYLEVLNFAYHNNIKKVIYASTGGVYQPSLNALSEDNFIKTDSTNFYESSKVCAEIISEPFKKYFDICILRFFFIYGKDQSNDMLLPRLVNNIRNGKDIKINLDGGIKITPVHAEDAALAITRTLQLNGSHVFNVSGDQIYSIQEISSIIGTLLGKQPIYEIENSTNQINFIATNEKLKQQGWMPNINFSEGIKDLIFTD